MRAALLLACAGSLALCGSASAATVRLARVGTFEQPVYVTAPRGDSRLFVVERQGRIRVVSHGRKLAAPFLDISADVLIENPSETVDQRGLLSIAFAPDYRRSGLLYAAYTGLDDTLHVDEFHVSPDPDRADPASRRPVLNAGAAGPFHHGGQLQFGPDGLLYASTGMTNDPSLPQDPGDPHGKILRIDPRVPGARPELFALGLRNPWRFSFDRRTGDMAIGDVGDHFAEEIDFLPHSARPGANFGWNVFEGRHRVSDAATPARYVPPVIEHRHSSGWCAVAGGYVVRDRSLRGLYGHYLYGDLCSGQLRSAVLRPGRSLRRAPVTPGVRYLDSFGEDGRGRVYAVSFLGGVFRLAAPKRR